MSLEKWTNQSILSWIFRNRLRSRIFVGFGIGVAISFISRIINERRKNHSVAARLYDIVPNLNKRNVHIKDLEYVENILTKIIKEGKDKLFIISDFDATLSRFCDDRGKRVPSSHAFFVHSPLLTEGQKRECMNLHRAYYPIEISTSISAEEKREKMEEWWTKAHNVLVSSGFSHSDLLKALTEHKILLREGAEHFFSSIHSLNIPLYVFSAGVDEVIKYVISESFVNPTNVHILANRMIFNEDSIISQFDEPLISGKKDGKLLSEFDPFKSRTLMRHNAILLGDMISDAEMIDGMSTVWNVLKIGFLNESASDLLPAYLENFDVVLVSEPSLDVVNGILARLL